MPVADLTEHEIALIAAKVMPEHDYDYPDDGKSE